MIINTTRLEMTERQYTEEQVRVVRRIMGETCLYRILGVEKEADEALIKRSFKKVGSK